LLHRPVHPERAKAQKERIMMIGTFTQEGEGYTGQITSFALHVSGMTFSPVPVKQGNGPDFIVTGHTAEGKTFEIGAAWTKTSKAGKPYLFVKLDGPTLAAPILCVLIRQPNGTYGLVWNRDRKADEEQAAA
jgi:uncharacterized protein (DUF736 family)